MQAIDFPFFAGEDVPWWLLDVDFLDELSVEEGSLHVHVMDWPSMVSSERK
jgi:hypothetical protein